MNTKLPLETLTVTTNSLEASVLQQLLEAEGIQAFIEGGAGADNFGGNSLVTAKIKVAPEDLPRARKLLDDARHRSQRPWYCQPCNEVNEGSFDLCWKCGEAREVVEGPMPDELAEELPASEPMPSEERLQKAIAGRPNSHDPRPYAPPQTEPSEHDDEDATVPTRVVLGISDEKLTEQIDFAYRLSILGLVTLPFVIHVWSLLLLLFTFSSSSQLSSQTLRRRTIALSIDCFVIVVGMLVVLSIV